MRPHLTCAQQNYMILLLAISLSLSNYLLSLMCVCVCVLLQLMYCGASAVSVDVPLFESFYTVPNFLLFILRESKTPGWANVSIQKSHLTLAPQET